MQKLCETIQRTQKKPEMQCARGDNTSLSSHFRKDEVTTATARCRRLAHSLIVLVVCSFCYVVTSDVLSVSPSPACSRSRPELAEVGRSWPELAGVGRSCLELSGVVRSCWELSGVVGSCRELSGAVRSCLELSGVVLSCPELS